MTCNILIEAANILIKKAHVLISPLSGESFSIKYHYKVKEHDHESPPNYHRLTYGIFVFSLLLNDVYSFQ